MREKVFRGRTRMLSHRTENTEVEQILLYGRTFTVETDHCGLQHLKIGKIRNARMMRWNLAMQNYSFNIKYLRGIDNVMADYLSRAIEYIRDKSNLAYKYP